MILKRERERVWGSSWLTLFNLDWLRVFLRKTIVDLRRPRLVGGADGCWFMLFSMLLWGPAPPLEAPSGFCLLTKNLTELSRCILDFWNQNNILTSHSIVFKYVRSYFTYSTLKMNFACTQFRVHVRFSFTLTIRVTKLSWWVFAAYATTIVFALICLFAIKRWRSPAARKKIRYCRFLAHEAARIGWIMFVIAE